MTNGDHEAQRRELSRAAARESAASRNRLAPLRKIKEKRIVDGELIEILECGHEKRPRQALFGGIGPARRRCLQCLERMEEAAGLGQDQ